MPGGAPNPNRQKLQGWSRFDQGVAERLRTLREGLGMTRVQMAALCDIRADQYGAIENGVRRLRFEEAILLAHHLDVDIYDLAPSPACNHVWERCSCEKPQCRRDICVLCEAILVRPRA